MWKQKLALGLSGECGVPLIGQLRLIRAAGFEGFFAPWESAESLRALAAEGAALGLDFQSVHAPFKRTAALWHEEEAPARQALEELMECLRACAENAVALMVAHAFIGFQEHTPSAIGLERFGSLIREAERLGVQIAFENTEGEEYLAALMETFGGSPAVGFCWDSGHELCYNGGKDLLAVYGGRLLGTHLNDNLGVSDYAGEIDWHDDLHLLPFDGIADWDGIAARLDRCGFRGTMTFELKRRSKPGRHENDGYEAMPLEQYLAACYRSACRVAAKRRLAPAAVSE